MFLSICSDFKTIRPLIKALKHSKPKIRLYALNLIAKHTIYSYVDWDERDRFDFVPPFRDLGYSQIFNTDVFRNILHMLKDENIEIHKRAKKILLEYVNSAAPSLPKQIAVYKDLKSIEEDVNEILMEAIKNELWSDKVIKELLYEINNKNVSKLYSEILLSYIESSQNENEKRAKHIEFLFEVHLLILVQLLYMKI